ncbi:YheU family protein [Thermodesulfobacteriota bacterium]
MKKLRSPIIIPHEQLSPEALQGLIEEFVSRDGTDTGYSKKSLEQDVARVKGQLKRGDAVIVYDQTIKNSNIVTKDHLNKSQKK